MIVAEIALTLTDFVVEASVRRSMGDVYPGERVTHAVMGILYGGMVATLIPVLWSWWQQPTALVLQGDDVPAWLRWTLTAMAAGVLLSGIRDAYAAAGGRGAAWPWKAVRHKEARGQVGTL